MIKDEQWWSERQRRENLLSNFQFRDAPSLTKFSWNHWKFNKNKRDRLEEKWRKKPVFCTSMKALTILKLQTKRLTLQRKELTKFPKSSCPKVPLPLKSKWWSEKTPTLILLNALFAKKIAVNLFSMLKLKFSTKLLWVLISFISFTFLICIEKALIWRFICVGIFIKKMQLRRLNRKLVKTFIEQLKLSSDF